MPIPIFPHVLSNMSTNIIWCFIYFIANYFWLMHNHDNNTKRLKSIIPHSLAKDSLPKNIALWLMNENIKLKMCNTFQDRCSFWPAARF